MRSTCGSPRGVGIACCLIAFAAGALPMAQQRTPVLVTRLSTGADGEARAQDVEVPLKPAGNSADVSEVFPATGLTFQRMAADDFGNWHTTPQPKYSLTLTGAIEIEVGGGQRVPIGPGNILFPGDATGKGHFNHRVGKEDRVSAQVLLTPAASCTGAFCVGAGSSSTVMVTRLRSGPDGKLQAEEIQRPSSDVTAVTGFQFMRVIASDATLLQRRRQYVIALRGGGTVDIGDRRTVALDAGQILVLDDEEEGSIAFRNRGPGDSLLVLFAVASQP